MDVDGRLQACRHSLVLPGNRIRRIRRVGASALRAPMDTNMSSSSSTPTSASSSRQFSLYAAHRIPVRRSPRDRPSGVVTEHRSRRCVPGTVQISRIHRCERDLVDSTMLVGEVEHRQWTTGGRCVTRPGMACAPTAPRALSSACSQTPVVRAWLRCHSVRGSIATRPRPQVEGSCNGADLCHELEARFN